MGDMMIFLVVCFFLSWLKVLMILENLNGFVGLIMGFKVLFFSNGVSVLSMFFLDVKMNLIVGGFVGLVSVMVWLFFFIVSMVFFFFVLNKSFVNCL